MTTNHLKKVWLRRELSFAMSRRVVWWILPPFQRNLSLKTNKKINWRDTVPKQLHFSLTMVNSLWTLWISTHKNTHTHTLYTEGIGGYLRLQINKRYWRFKSAAMRRLLISTNYRLHGEVCCLHLQGISSPTINSPWRRSQQAPSIYEWLYQ